MRKENDERIRFERELKRAAILASKDAENFFKGMKVKPDLPVHRKGLRNKTEIQLDKRIDSYRENPYKLRELEENTKVAEIFAPCTTLHLHIIVINVRFFCWEHYHLGIQ